MFHQKLADTWIIIAETIPGIEEAWQFVQDFECGATQLFTGTTRNHHDGKNVTDLHYDCYEEMAVAECQKILDGLLKKYQIRRIALFHKTGHAPIGEKSLVVAISAPHRRPAMEAVTELIDLLKESVPIWKRETFEDGEVLWKEEQMISTNKRSH